MAQEPDNLVLVHLREMRGEIQGIRVQIQGITAKLEEHDRRFDQIDRRFDDFQLLVSHSVGLGATNFMKSRENDQRYEATEAWQRRAEQRFDQIEHRLTKVEEKSDT
jgi:hypothetical protein